jgi:hypothetical protein
MTEEKPVPKLPRTYLGRLLWAWRNRARKRRRYRGERRAQHMTHVHFAPLPDAANVERVCHPIDADTLDRADDLARARARRNAADLKNRLDR